MNKTAIVIIIFLLILASAIFVLYFSFIKKDITGSVIMNRYSYTKAICNETNYCQDHEIFCEGNETIMVNPITGAAVQQSEDWEDPRDNETINKLCG